MLTKQYNAIIAYLVITVTTAKHLYIPNAGISMSANTIFYSFSLRGIRIAAKSIIISHGSGEMSLSGEGVPPC